MKAGIIGRFIAILILFLSASMIAPLIVSLVSGEPYSGLLLSLIVTALTGIFLFFTFRVGQDKDPHLTHREGMIIVTLGWISAGFFGAMPYFFSGVIADFTNAYFESISGFTTTGASILDNIEALPKGLLLWRSITQWLGGMGIIVLSIAILPFLGVGGMQLYRAEMPSPVVDKLKPTISDTAKILWKVYLGITMAEIVLLLAGGMPLFDAVCHSFCTMPTGGFSPKNASIAYYNSAYLESVFMFFMLVAGINFSLHYRLLKGEITIFGRDKECRVFLILAAICTLILTIDIHVSLHASLSRALREAAFQLISIITTTGFVSADYETWPVLSQLILLACMFMGAMAGSTGGGMKTMRVILLVKHGFKEIFHIAHPHAVTSIKLGGKPVPREVISSILGFFVFYLGLFVLASFIMAGLGLDMVSAAASVAASIGNIGPGLGLVGPTSNYAQIPTPGKWILIFCMLLGRLEIYTVIALFTPEFWRK